MDGAGKCNRERNRAIVACKGAITGGDGGGGGEVDQVHRANTGCKVFDSCDRTGNNQYEAAAVSTSIMVAVVR